MSRSKVIAYWIFGPTTPKMAYFSKNNSLCMEFLTFLNKFKIMFQKYDNEDDGNIYISKLSYGYYAEARLTLKIEHLKSFIDNISNIFEENTAKIIFFI